MLCTFHTDDAENYRCVQKGDSCKCLVLCWTSNKHDAGVFGLQVTATLSAAALKVNQSQASEQGDTANSVLSSLKRVLNVNGKDDIPVRS